MKIYRFEIKADNRTISEIGFSDLEVKTNDEGCALFFSDSLQRGKIGCFKELIHIQAETSVWITEQWQKNTGYPFRLPKFSLILVGGPK